MRGVIVSKLIAVTRFGMTMQSELDPQNVRTWLLHWDKLDYPVGGFDRRVEPDVDFLQAAGVLQRTLADPAFESSDKAEPENGGLFDSVLATYQVLDRKEPGAWAIARTKLPETPWDHLEPPRNFEDQSEGRGLFIRLTSALPVPNADVPLNEILEFKDRRRAELAALRSHLDELYQNVLAAPDRPSAELAALDHIQVGVRDVMRAEPAFKWKLVDISGRFNLVAGATAFVAAQQAGLGILASLGAGAATASLHVGPALSMKDGRDRSPFEYVAAYHRELFPPPS